MEQEKRGQWASNFGFLMAAIGSAIGLGNIWGFPYKMGANGGFIFLIIYLALVSFVGFATMLSMAWELSEHIGKSAKSTHG
jgi:NSS family neurotransmitter:Na+ symporter